jgi:hypothetical protein
MRTSHIGIALAMALTAGASAAGMAPTQLRIVNRPANVATGSNDKHLRRRGWRFPGNSATAFKPNGARECARRRRQIAAGTLREENGLSVSLDHLLDRGFEFVPRLRKQTIEW